MNIYQAILEMQRKGESGALCTIIESSGSVPRHTGSKMLVSESGQLTGSVGGGEIESRVKEEAKQSRQDGKTRRLSYNMVDPTRGDPGICGGQAEIFVEPILAQPLILVIGGGHVGKTVTHLAKWLGFRVVVSDDRAEFCNPVAVPEADDYVCCPMAEIAQNVKINSQSYLILTTRGVAIDTPGLPALMETSAAYLGIIGSKRRWLATRKNLIEMGIKQEKLDKVVSPIGLELKAETPEEIAVSILAEILMLRSGASGLRMTMKQGK
jgi:xanthine dehydrogenase accessory factor